MLGIFYEIMRFENFFLKFWARLEIFCFEFLIFCYGLKFLKLHKGAACAQLVRARAQLVRSINSIQVNFCRRCSPMSSAVRRIDALLRLGATWKLERRRPTCGIELEGGVSLRGFCPFFRSYRGVVGATSPARMVAHTPQC